MKLALCFTESLVLSIETRIQIQSNSKEVSEHLLSESRHGFGELECFLRRAVFDNLFAPRFQGLQESDSPIPLIIVHVRIEIQNLPLPRHDQGT